MIIDAVRIKEGCVFRNKSGCIVKITRVTHTPTEIYLNLERIEGEEEETNYVDIFMKISDKNIDLENCKDFISIWEL